MVSSGSTPPLISVLFPTRGRPALARRFIESLLATAHDPATIELVLYFDDDDPTVVEIGELPGNVRHITGPRLGMGAANTACLSHATGDILLLANDDIVVRTDGWDTQVRVCDARFADGIYLAWPNDGFASNRISTFPILTRRTCDLLAQPYPATYRKAFIDTDLLDIFMRLERRGHSRLSYLDHVVFEHQHYRLGKRAVDETSNVQLRFVDDAAFLSRIPIRQEQAERLAAACSRQPVVPAPADVPSSSISRNPIKAIGRFARAFLTDPGLRPRRRLYLFVWYCGRYIAARALRVPV